ncbi:AMP-binding protein [Amorphus sp. 3PC139-8]
MTPGSHVAHNAARFPEKTALIQGERRMSYAELDRASDRIARGLLARGVAPGDRVAMLMDSCIDWVVVYVGVAKAGCTAVPFNYRLTAADLALVLEDSCSRLLFRSAGLTQIPDDTDLVNEVVVADTSGLDAFVANAGDGPCGVEVSPSGIQAILYTGGTTGRSKGAMLSHENIFWNTIHESLDTGMHEDDNTLLATPLHHSAALNCWLLPALYLGATATILPKYTTEDMICTIERERCTNAFTPPSMARDIYKHPLAQTADLSCFERWYVGGANLSRNDREAMHALIPGVQIFYQYGLTEAGVIVTVLKEKDYERAPGSIGRAFLNFDVKILREDLSDAETGEVGEIAVRGPSVMQGYFNNPEATAAVFHDGWLRTGDMGAMDEDGFVTFHDRLKDMVKTGGLNVYSQEVEQVLLRHDEVREAAIIGLPSDVWGEEVTAVIVLHDGAEADETSLIAFAKEELAGYKVPKRVLIVSYADMPINYSGKIVKRDLRARLMETTD